MRERLQAAMQQNMAVQQIILSDESLLQIIDQVAAVMVQTFRRDGKILFCGNGGSAADAQHLAAELSGRYYFDRAPLFAEALHVNTSYLTAVANDYGYEAAYGRLVRAMGRPGDLLVAMSTSGNSPNVITAAQAAINIGMTVVGMTGQAGGKLREICDFTVRVPSTDTPRIQEMHMLIGHTWCETVEATLFKPPGSDAAI